MIARPPSRLARGAICALLVLLLIGAPQAEADWPTTSAWAVTVIDMDSGRPDAPWRQRWIVRGQDDDLVRPNVRDPGTDFSDFANSAEVVPVGEYYLSIGWNYVTARTPRITDNFAPFAIRFGVVENVELRITGDGVTQEGGRDYLQTGFSPLSFGGKWHLLDADDECLRPALGLEVDVATRIASDFFDPGHHVPSVSLNFDQPLFGEWTLNWNIGVTWEVDDAGGQFAQWNLPWSLVYAFSDDFEVYTQGLLNLPAGSGVQQEYLAGIGFNAYLGNQWSIWGNHNWGLTQESDFRCVLLGVTYAGSVPSLALWNRHD